MQKGRKVFEKAWNEMSTSMVAVMERPTVKTKEAPAKEPEPGRITEPVVEPKTEARKSIKEKGGW